MIAAPELKRALPEAVGINPKGIERFMELVYERQIALHSFMLLRHGKVAAEAYYAPFRRGELHHIFSISKSVTSAAVGIAIGEGRFGLQDKAADLLRRHVTGEVHPYTAQMTVEHLLKMATVYRRAPYSEAEGWINLYLTSPPQHPPGFSFAYDTAGTNMLCAIVQETTGQTVHEYLQPRLFDAIGMGPLEWRSCAGNINNGGSGIRCTTDGLARLGQLYLQDGIWDGKRVLPEGWVDRSTARQVDNSGAKTMLDGKPGYGYQFWRLRNNAYCAFGLGGQFVVVMPDCDAVFVSTANTQFVRDGQQQILDCLWEALYPAMKETASDAAGLANGVSLAGASGSAADGELAKRLASLQLSLPPGQAHSGTEAEVNSRTYRLQDNRYGFTACRFEFADQTSILSFTRAPGAEEVILDFGIHHWVTGTDRVFSGTESCCSAATWVDGQTCIIHMHLLDTVQMVMLICHFEADTMMIQIVMPGIYFNEEMECDLIGVASL